ncbi:MAG: acyl transferase [Bacteroidia bacterium]
MGELESELFTSKLTNFEEWALQVYRYQQAHNPVLTEYTRMIKRTAVPDRMADLCFLPASFFKTHGVITGSFEPEAVFTSSATTGQIPSRHTVKSLQLYRKSTLSGFSLQYGEIKDTCILALLPSYLEREGSSLVWMADYFMQQSGHPLNGFYLNNFSQLHSTLLQLRAANQKTILIGVTFALLDFTEQYPLSFPELIVMETGGMKGRKKEMIREEVHHLLKKGFQTSQIHSEYGMTELLSQAYAQKDGRFNSPPWMKCVITDSTDPFTILPHGKSGVINMIDLANLHSCAFIQTADIGRAYEDGTFEVLGRLDNSEIRGCSLMYF